MELVSTVVGTHRVHQQDVLGSLVQTTDLHLERREHPPGTEEEGNVTHS